jgi:hypothetical protein
VKGRLTTEAQEILLEEPTSGLINNAIHNVQEEVSHPKIASLCFPIGLDGALLNSTAGLEINRE